MKFAEHRLIASTEIHHLTRQTALQCLGLGRAKVASTRLRRYHDIRYVMCIRQ